MKKGVIVCIILDVLAIIFLFFSYGPIGYFRELLVTTAMTTKSHKYLARTLYSEKWINEILSKNYVEEVREDTNTDEIDFSKMHEQDVYESAYEEQILKRDEGNNLYKLIKLSGSGYKGFLVAIYDPSRVELVLSNRFGTWGQFLQNMARDNNALVAINAGGFADAGGVGNGGIPTGTVIKDGQVVYKGDATGWSGGLAGFNNDNVLVLTKGSVEEAINAGMRDAVEFGPFLIVNGKRAIVKGNGGWGVSSRTALAQRKDGIVLFLVIDGRQPGYSLGVDMNELTNILVKYKAYNAVNLDGGASSSLIINNEIINKPCAVSATGERWIPNAWMLK